MSVNCCDFVELYYASAAVGATFVPLNFRAKTEELQYMADASDVNVFFVAERYFPILQEIRSTLPRSSTSTRSISRLRASARSTRSASRAPTSRSSPRSTTTTPRW